MSDPLTVDERIKRVLLESNGRWLSATEVASRMGVAYQAVARRLCKLALFAEIEAREDQWTAAEFRVRKRHLYRAWGGWVVYPSWMAPRGSEKDVKRARLVVGRASLRGNDEEDT